MLIEAWQNTDPLAFGLSAIVPDLHRNVSRGPILATLGAIVDQASTKSDFGSHNVIRLTPLGLAFWYQNRTTMSGRNHSSRPDCTLDAYSISRCVVEQMEC